MDARSYVCFNVDSYCLEALGALTGRAGCATVPSLRLVEVLATYGAVMAVLTIVPHCSFEPRYANWHVASEPTVWHGHLPQARREVQI